MQEAQRRERGLRAEVEGLREQVAALMTERDNESRKLEES